MQIFFIIYLFDGSLIFALVQVPSFLLISLHLLHFSFSTFLRLFAVSYFMCNLFLNTGIYGCTLNFYSHILQFLFFLILIYLFIYLFGCAGSQLRHAGSFSCGMWDLVPWPGIKTGPPALGVRHLNHWTTREVPTDIQCLYQFPMAAITNCHKLGGLKQQKYFFSLFWKSENQCHWAKIRVSAGFHLTFTSPTSISKPVSAQH